MNMLLWVLQVLAALVYGSPGFMKFFVFDKVSHDVSSFGALPRNVWTALGVLEMLCTAGILQTHFTKSKCGAPGTRPQPSSVTFVKLKTCDQNLADRSRGVWHQYGAVPILRLAHGSYAWILIPRGNGALGVL